MQHFMPWHGLAGGLLIGVSAALFLLVAGRISGISGIIESALTFRGRGVAANLAYLVGLPMGAVLITYLAPNVVPKLAVPATWPVLIGAGLLVGVGARIGGGCTSGHGVCGLPRLSVRSIVATGIFMTVAAATVFVTRHLI